MGPLGARGVAGDEGGQTDQQDRPEFDELGPEVAEAPETVDVRQSEVFGDPRTETQAGEEPGVPSDDDESGRDEPATLGATATSTELRALSGRVDDLGALLASQSDAIARFHERSAAQEEIITRLHDRVQTLQAGETRHLIKPVVGGLVALYGEILTQARYIQRDLTLQETQELLEVLAVRVENTLATLGVESYGAAVGDPFSPRRHQAVDVVVTDRPDQHQTVAALLRPGFEDPTEPRAMFVAQVTVSKYVEPEPPTEPEPRTDSQGEPGRGNLQFDPDSSTSMEEQPNAEDHEREEQ